ncbi:50S ribosomal protein L18 [Lactobacillus helveticus]|uniref:Large ribosomal subunit protein uL18 n=2 Tax=Lactobacillus helveticus TaxID=1587 RepID=A0AAV4E9F1_LACHE|nr:50S ribosomal protein L18 [Lactobacillus helveticus]EGF35053.1 50S ribosomal protein l18 [Lactobacillus helveticus MTCC 5463]AGQ24165.1 ribosomal protein L18 [Lactobacillus helveticus CNRZ32]AHI11290.1 50S ribosomal protein L18 [Lactobacillus helveticus H9]AJY60912.1 50S ribosomal protein L18 [Lactobacillus helveticus]AKG66151.1 50S ribosomal protein L18 [Lactobacillus helveticus]
MISKPDKNKLRLKRHKRIRSKISGTAERPRLSIFRSNKNIYAQLIDDVAGVTLASASSLDENVSEDATKVEQATAVGKAIAEAAKAKNISTVVFDRSGYLYHGRIQALADAARENGLDF